MKRSLITAALFALVSSPTWAADQCSVDILGTDQMTFNMDTINVGKDCKQFTVNLIHPGTLPKNVMGHNWVLTTKADMNGAATDGLAAGLDNDYVKPNDPRVIAHTKVIGGGEKTSVTVDTASLKADEEYAYFCSFPGHAAIMKGTFKIEG
ncbi:azurin [Pseudomonas duriflava]|uniref:Azurin n=1 Tax=Pseudomonas duriflava TaxID=459528 RepID=A0A562Q862_9PSED|nr:azurin [Pseudomonas duriflava]TWI52370.1 azurin [Pseudomonas duriflava]